jgi:hypothetical protein
VPALKPILGVIVHKVDFLLRTFSKTFVFKGFPWLSSNRPIQSHGRGLALSIYQKEDAPKP